MKDFYLRNVLDLIKDSKTLSNEPVYEKVSQQMFGSVLSQNELKELSKEELSKLYYQLNRALKEATSPIDIQKLARAIQNSRSGIGGSALTNFVCKFCNEVETWSSTAVPHICMSCATDMARNIVYYQFNILKD